MLLNLTDILTSEDKVEEKLVEYECDTFTCNGVSVPIINKDACRLVLKNMGKGKAQIKGSFQCTLGCACDRCLKDVSVPIHLEIMESISTEEIEHPTDADELSFMQGYQLDTDKLIGNEIMINWPMKVLCQEDCKGICKKCGKDLNLGECGCDTFIPDPRMAVINDIFNANKEV